MKRALDEDTLSLMFVLLLLLSPALQPALVLALESPSHQPRPRLVSHLGLGSVPVSRPNGDNGVRTRGRAGGLM